jgi:cellulose synthase/poly-beta-1,6-N-acetylglucosamine synthase-like glycosyltransferase
MQLGARAFADFPSRLQFPLMLLVYALSAAVSSRLVGSGWLLLVPFLLGCVLALVAAWLVQALAFPGAFLMVTQAQFYLTCLAWGLSLISTAAVDPLTRALMLAVFVLVSAYLLIALVQRLEQMEVICRRDWRWPCAALPPGGRSRCPKVSVHVPVCSEPPDMVMATLDGLAALDYPNYEVLVVDNNTRDPDLWRPVEAHCRQLGARFRFFHVEELPGAKAGALNFALQRTAADAELISIVDSDYYVVRADFLSSLVGYFDDPAMGFVQTAQAYRDWERHSYLSMCNWEYRFYLDSTLLSRNERMAAITLGTMGLIRRTVLDEIGGWADWSVTEDSELALRIHARGYRSTYVNTVFGRGLIPESFGGYKRQRFRWCFGAIQEIRRHLPLLLPAPLGRASQLATAQKLFHLMHALDTLKSGLEFLMVVFATALTASMLLRGEVVPVPSYIWLIFALAAALVFSLKLYVFRALGWSVADTLGAALAHAALDHTIGIAGLASLLSRSTAWRKTSKFRAAPAGLSALGVVMPELLLGSALAVAALELARSGRASGLLALLLVAGLLKAAKYLLAPILVVLAELGIRARIDAAPSLSKS